MQAAVSNGDRELSLVLRIFLNGVSHTPHSGTRHGQLKFVSRGFGLNREFHAAAF